MREYARCHFCQKYDGTTYEPCRETYKCGLSHSLFEIDETKIFEKAIEDGLSVADVIALMKAED